MIKPLRILPLVLTGLAAAASGCRPTAGASAAAASGVTVLATPGSGIQPQAVTDERGTLHLVYYQGAASGGDIFYVRRAPGSAHFTAPLRVNSQPGSAVAMGTIRGAQIALGKGGRVHVAWNGTAMATPRNPIKGSPMLYTRLNDAGTEFEPQRNLMRRTFNLDGGGTLAADPAGHVYVAWHGNDAEGQTEADRRLWVTTSTDDGKTFTPEVAASPQAAGACACCGTRALASKEGQLYVLFRSAGQRVNRDIYLVSSQRPGQFASQRIDPWNVDT